MLLKRYLYRHTACKIGAIDDETYIQESIVISSLSDKELG